MSGPLAGYAETFALNAEIVAIVAARRGEPASLRFPDFDGVAPSPVHSALIDRLAQLAAAARAGGCAATIEVADFGRCVKIEVEPDAVERLVSGLRRALSFSTGA